MILCKIHPILGVSPEVYLINILIAVPVFFFLRWILKKLVKSDLTRKITTCILTIIITPLFYIILIFIWISMISYYPKHDFDKEKWASEEEVRYEMSKDLIKSNILLGKTKQEVIELLGDDGNKMESDLWNYSLGFVPRLLSIDPDVLTIEFKNGKVIKVGQHET